MSFIIPNQTGSTLENARQAQPDQKDFEIMAMGLEGTGVISGCAVTQQTVADMTVKVALGVARYQNGADITVAADTSVTIEAADGTNPRFDYIMVNSADGTIVNPSAGDGKGTAASNPVFPAIPANRIILAVVHVTENETAITDAHIVDKGVTILTGSPACRISETGLVTTSNGEYVDFAGATVDVDNDGIADTANDKLEIQTAGVYLIQAHWLATGGTGGTYRTMKVYVNAAIHTDKRAGVETSSGVYSLAISNEVVFLHDCAVNDEIKLYQESDADVSSQTLSYILSVVRVA